MAAMMRLAQRIVVLHHGEKIAEGTPARDHPATGASSTPTSARSSSLLRLEGIDAFYGDLQALSGVSLEVREGEIVALVGANAAGKSTTLRVISGLVAPRRGRVILRRRRISPTCPPTSASIAGSSRCRRAAGSSPS